MTFFDDDDVLGTATLGTNGQATFPTSTLIAGPHSITAAYEGDSQAAESHSTPFSLNISQATPVVTWTPPAAITYGSALGSGQLNASAPVPGTFAYTPPAGTVPGAGNGQTLSVIFTPSSSNYLAVSKSVTIDVLPAAGGGSPVNLVTTRTLARDGSGQVVAALTIANTGGTAAQNVTLSAAKIGTTSRDAAAAIAGDDCRGRFRAGHRHVPWFGGCFRRGQQPHVVRQLHGRDVRQQRPHYTSVDG